MFPLSLLGLVCRRVADGRMARVGSVLLVEGTRVDHHSSFGSRVVAACVCVSS